ncbi:MAG: diacylglycerol kinase [Deinococcales bacterium]
MPMPDPPRHAPPRNWVKNFLYATAGIAYVWRTERNFRLEVVVSVVVIGAALLLRMDVVPIVFCCVMVMSLELINTALEAVVDLVSPTYHPLAKIAKDVAAAAVLISSLGSLFVGLWLFLPVLWR